VGGCEIESADGVDGVEGFREAWGGVCWILWGVLLGGGAGVKVGVDEGGMMEAKWGILE